MGQLIWAGLLVAAHAPPTDRGFKAVTPGAEVQRRLAQLTAGTPYHLMQLPTDARTPEAALAAIKKNPAVSKYLDRVQNPFDPEPVYGVAVEIGTGAAKRWVLAFSTTADFTGPVVYADEKPPHVPTGAWLVFVHAPVDPDLTDPWRGRWVTEGKGPKVDGPLTVMEFGRKDGELWVELTYERVPLVGGGVGEKSTERHPVRCAVPGRDGKDGSAEPEATFHVSRRGISSTFVLRVGERDESGSRILRVMEVRENHHKGAERWAVRTFALIREKPPAPKAGLVRTFGDARANLLTLPAAEVKGKDTVKMSRLLKVGDAELVLVPVKLPLSRGHLLESVKCVSSDEAVLVVADVLEGAPGAERSDGVQYVTLFLKPKAKGKAKVTVEFKFSVFAEPNLEYEFTIEEGFGGFDPKRP